MTKSDLKVFTGTTHPRLAKRICEYLGVPLGEAVVTRFPDGEIDVKIDEDIRGGDVFILQPTCHPVNESLIELLILIDCCKRASADRITAVLPYYGYARKDRKDEGRVPITAKLVANLITSAGANRVLTIELHAAQIQGFFDIPVDHLFATPVFTAHFKELSIPNLCVVGPDVGSIKIARAYSKRLGGDLAVVDKRRSGPLETEVMHVIGDVKGKNVLIIDDIISTGSSISKAAKAVKERGARDVYLCAAHPVLCGDALQRIEEAEVKEVVVSDTIPVEVRERPPIRVLSVAPLLAEAIRRIHCAESVSSLFL